MKHAKPARKQRTKLILMAAGMWVLGLLLIFLSIQIRPAAEAATPAKPAATASAPATSSAPATRPAPASPPTGRQPLDPGTTVNRNMSGLLLLFGLVAFTVTWVCVILVVADIRKSRPAWQTQTRYPRRR